MTAPAVSSRDQEAHRGPKTSEPRHLGCYERQRIAVERVPLAWAAMGNCQLCEHRCGANRLTGERGPCRAGVDARVFSAQVEVSDELELIPTFAIAFSGCDMRCDFCITGKESWNPRAGSLLIAGELAEAAVEALEEGARTIMILGGEPTIHLPHVLKLVAALPNDAKLVWKTNGHASAAARELLAGLFDVWLVDFKFGNDDCARRVARVDNYCAIVKENLFWAEASSELIIRHLVMPGHVDCCWKPVAEWIAANQPQTKVNLRTGFWPAWRSHRHPELIGTTNRAESERARRIARDCALKLVE